MKNGSCGCRFFSSIFDLFKIFCVLRVNHDRCCAEKHVIYDATIFEIACFWLYIAPRYMFYECMIFQ